LNTLVQIMALDSLQQILTRTALRENKGVEQKSHKHRHHSGDQHAEKVANIERLA
jgi:hypothetical protein